MNQSEFLRALHASPGDTRLRLIFADWLEEHGDLRAAGWRAMATTVVANEYEGLDTGDGLYFVFGDGNGDGFGDGSFYGDSTGNGGQTGEGHTGPGPLASFDGNLSGIDDDRRFGAGARHKPVIGAGAVRVCGLRYLPAASAG